MISTQELPVWAWLAFYILAIACSAGSLWLTVFPRGRSRGWMWLRIGLAALVVPVVEHMIGIAEQGSTDDAKVWWRLGVFALGIATVLALFAHEAWIGKRHWWRKWGRPATFLSVSVTVAISIGLRYYRTAVPATDNMYVTQLVHSVRDSVEVEEMFGLTDLGRKVPLMRFESTDSDFEPLQSVPEPFRTRVIVAESSNSTANCHGWIFTGGHYIVPGAFVDFILEDNGYRIVPDPRVGDLVVYRNDSGTPIHTGIVKAAGDDGFLLIESKWGALDTYFHLPYDQVYSSNYAYYRSLRDGHAIHLIRYSPPQPKPAGEKPIDGQPAVPGNQPVVKLQPAVNG